ncbi:cytochrome c oxidase subunit 3 [Nocardia mexicana]|uniref:Cytochrome aa3 subunit 3 n=1 Tax=Nocardia mexicana TaxID=279262 RepID=A0A370GSZ7_9NOCA|nr:cytochrome c oxidase subunit 3 [Nocardia mexicana]RDI45043.1 nitric oxide reductase NorE protein [Nocardia mexicana]
MTNSEPSTAPPPRMPADGHMWVMVFGDLVIFGGYFVIFMIYRAMTPDDFLLSQQRLDLTAGVANTVVLLTSSWFIARSVAAARTGEHPRAIRLTCAAGLCGALFILVKAYEWATRIAHGDTNSTLFFSFYYVLTGVHLLHVALGLLIMGIVVRELRNPRRRRMVLVESGAVFWHMVDLLWIVIFALFYLMR